MAKPKGGKRGALTDAEKLVKYVMAGDNVKAKETLESILKVKVARRVRDTLAS